MLFAKNDEGNVFERTLYYHQKSPVLKNRGWLEVPETDQGARDWTKNEDSYPPVNRKGYKHEKKKKKNSTNNFTILRRSLEMILVLEIFCFVFFGLVPPSSTQNTLLKRKTAYIKGDIIIGTLVSVHEQPKGNKIFPHKCGRIREQYGIQRVEAAFRAIDKINKDKSILPNIDLGIEIRDSCWYATIALEQSIEFIRDSITSPEQGSKQRHNVTRCPGSKVDRPADKNLVGVVGPGSSATTIQVQNLLQLFRIPQVGYSATSRDLSDKNRFSYFQRVVPSDFYQAQVMVDLVKKFNWTYVSAVHTEGNYGQSGIAAFRELAEKNNICIAKEDRIRSNSPQDEFDQVIKQLASDNQAKVVICFCEGITIQNLLKASRRAKLEHRFQFVGSDGWADRADIVEDVKDVAVGGLSIRINSPYVSDFDDYYMSLTPDNNSRNPWFREFWEHRFQCNLPSEQQSVPNLSINKTNECTGNESLSEGYTQDTKMAFIEKAIFTMAYGLHNIHQDVCGGRPGICSDMRPLNGSMFRDYLLNVTFPHRGMNVSFDDKGDPPGRYDIMNFQKLANGSYQYINVGYWNDGDFVVNESLVIFNSVDAKPPTSVCSEPCAQGQVKSFPQTGDASKRCCWVCDDCKQNEYLLNETTCESCGVDNWPNASKTGCDAIPVDFMDWSDDGAIGALTLAGMGFIATCFTMAVFVKNNQTPIVKASTRELSYIIFMGMMVSYLSSLPLLHEPTIMTCAFSRMMPGLSFSMIYAALVTKTNRIARILAGNKKIRIRKLKFMSATAQVGITCILISVEIFISLCMLIYQPPDAINHYPRIGKVVSICNTTPLGVIAPMGWVFILIGMCTVYAIKTRNLPENFNEAKFIGFSMYTTCVIWMAWVPIYFGSDHKIICMSVCTSLSAFVTLALLFFPKIYIILCRPEKNDRAAFKTATNVRCHIGAPMKPKISEDKTSTGQSPSFRAFCSAADNKWTELVVKMRSAMNQGGSARGALLKSGNKDNPKVLLKRETSIWSEMSVSHASSVTQHRDNMLQKAFGSQLDLDHESSSHHHHQRWSQEEKGTMTCDELLDPLIPRMRRRVVRAVREGHLTTVEGREFFSLTHGWMQQQADAAKIEYQKLQETKAAEEAARKAEEERLIQEKEERRASKKLKKNPWGTVRSEVETKSFLVKLKGRNAKSFKEVKSPKHSIKTSSTLDELNRPDNLHKQEDNKAKKTETKKTSDNNKYVKNISSNNVCTSSPGKPKTSQNIIYTNAIVTSAVSPTCSSPSITQADQVNDKKPESFPDDTSKKLPEESESVNISAYPHNVKNHIIPVEVNLTRISVTSEPSDIQNIQKNAYCSPFVELKPSFIYPTDNCKTSEISILISKEENDQDDTKDYSYNDSSLQTNKKDPLLEDKLQSAKENELIILGLLRKRSLMRAKSNENTSDYQGKCSSKQYPTEEHPIARQKCTKIYKGPKLSSMKPSHQKLEKPQGMIKSKTMNDFDPESKFGASFNSTKSLSDSHLLPSNDVDSNVIELTRDFARVQNQQTQILSPYQNRAAAANSFITYKCNTPPVSPKKKDHPHKKQENHANSKSSKNTGSKKQHHRSTNSLKNYSIDADSWCGSENEGTRTTKFESECETDDSTNIEDFFRGQGISFDRTSKRSKKL